MELKNQTKHVNKLIFPFSMVLVLCLPIFNGCKKSETDEKVAVQYLSSIPENQHYASLPLVGTYWELTGFADARFGTIETAQASKRNYRLIFEEDGSINGIISPNQAGGSYTLDPPNKLIIDPFAPITYIAVLFDDTRYMDAMKKVSSYKLSPKGLSLYYGKDTFLLFRPVVFIAYPEPI